MSNLQGALNLHADRMWWQQLSWAGICMCLTFAVYAGSVLPDLWEL